MAEELTQQPTSEPLAEPQQASDATVGETAQVDVVQSTTPGTEQPVPVTQNVEQLPEDYTWEGNDVEKLPKELQARAKGILRYLHEQTQGISDSKHYAEAYHAITNHPEFKEFLDWKDGKGNSQQQALPELTEDIILSAQTDPSKFPSVVQQIVQSSIQPIVQQAQQEIAAIRQELSVERKRSELNSFISKHPDFIEIDKTIMKAAVAEASRQGKSFDYAYKIAKESLADLKAKTQAEIQKEIQKKKAAVTASPTTSMEPQVIYVANDREANRIAFENARLGKRVDVRVDPKRAR